MSREVLWPLFGTGADLAGVLADAANAGRSRNNGRPDDLVNGYLRWVTEQVRMLQGRLHNEDLNRLLTTPRYWATVANPNPTPPTVGAVSDEIQFRTALMDKEAQTLRQTAARWQLKDEKFASLVVVDTNFWLEVDGSLSDIDWHASVGSADGPGTCSPVDELRIVVPMVVVDELDNLTHKANLRPRAIGATRWLYKHLGRGSENAHELVAPRQGRGAVTAQLVFEQRGHVRVSNNDEEIVETAVRLRDFLGHPPRQTFFLTYDAGAAFRAENSGLMPRLLTK